MFALVVTTATALGLCVGSFLNVVIGRVPAGRSVVHPPSACPYCQTRLLARDLVPVVSWVALGRKCRTCAVPVSPQYPAVEALTAALFAIVGARFVAAPLVLPAMLVLAAALISLAGIDLATRRLPRSIVLGTAAAGVPLLTIAALAGDEPHRLITAAVGAAACFGALFVVHLVAPRGLGFGDVRLAGVIGLYCGWLGLAHAALALFAAYVLGTLAAVALMAAGRAHRRTALPFGPFLAAGALVAIVAGDPIVSFWLGR